MSRVLLLHLDGKTPNVALMRLAAHHRAAGDDVELRRVAKPGQVERHFGDDFDRVYASLIFEWTRPVAERLLKVRPDAIIGGTGWDERITLSQHGVEDDGPLDYRDYPAYRHSIGFTQRGCRLACHFCKVKAKEGDVREVAPIRDIWRGEPWPRNVLLLDNDFFGQKVWPERIAEMKSGGFRVCFNQGFNVRLIDDEQAAAIASVPYYDDQFKERRLYTAWDNRKDEARLFRNLEALVRHGVKPDDIVVYMLVAYDHATKSPRPYLVPDDFHRHRRLREFGCRPYPMPFVRTDETRAFQRWIVRRIDLKVSWEGFKAVNFRPERLGRDNGDHPLFPWIEGDAA